MDSENNENNNNIHVIYSNVAFGFDNVKDTPLILTSFDNGNSTPSFYRVANNNNGNNTSSNSNSIILVAGKIEDLNFTITNNNNTPITDAVITLSPQTTSSVEILGYSQWTLQSLAPHTSQEFSTKVFASTSLIDAPVSFLVTVQYISNAQSKIGSYSLGANIVGDIKISINDVAINYIGGVPNLAGSLLNQGNTQALFTTIELARNRFSSATSQSHSSSLRSSSLPTSTGPGSLPSQQYLGDLDADSPLPFNIPLDLILNNNTSPGAYPLLFKVTYSDALRNIHEVTINKTVTLKPSQRHTNTNEGPNFFGFLSGGSSRAGRGQSSSTFGIGLPMMIIIVAIIAAVAIFLIIRKRRKSRVPTYSKSEGDIETFLDDSQLLDKNRDVHRK